MEETKMQHVNTFKVIGKLVKADVKLGTSTKTGQPYASVKTFVQSVINGETKEFEIDFYSSLSRTAVTVRNMVPSSVRRLNSRMDRKLYSIFPGSTLSI